ncbi:hypothetical protein LTR60_007649, partial [Cryomyces antarcticus]
FRHHRPLASEDELPRPGFQGGMLGNRYFGRGPFDDYDGRRGRSRSRYGDDYLDYYMDPDDDDYEIGAGLRGM